MPAILTPALALRHLRELSTDVRAAVALTAAGEPIAGDAAIAQPARALLAQAEEAPPGAITPAQDTERSLTLATERGAVLVARTPATAFVVVAGPHALLALLRHDLDTLAADTWQGAAGEEPARRSAADDAETPADSAAQRRLAPLAQALIDAAEGISAQ